MSLKKSLKNIILSIAPLRKLARRMVYSAQRSEYAKAAEDVATDRKLIAFCTFDGRDYSDSPKAVFEYVKKCDAYSDYRFVWLFNDPGKYSFLEDERTDVVRTGTKEADRYMQSAGYWIFNFRAPDRYEPKEDQVYIQCWHGTPLKRLGYDITCSGNVMNTVSEIREKYRSDAQRFSYMTSCCSFVTDRFISAWDLKTAGKEEAVLETGYPRNDRLALYYGREKVMGRSKYPRNDSPDLCSGDEAENVKGKLGLPEDKKIILYAPTWRDDQHDADIGYVYDNPVDFDCLKEELSDEYIILFRAHYLVANSFDFNAYEGFVYDVSGHDDINDLYIISDILVTDYSSVFFDYALLRRPMYFYMYDMEAYANELRGFYIDTDSLPGPIVRTEKELAEAIKTGKGKTYLEDFNNRYNTMNDGKASMRLAEAVLGGGK